MTGCGGFLGREICRQLCQRGDRVVGLARGDYPDLDALGVRRVRGDLADPRFVQDVFAAGESETASSFGPIDAVVHSAAVAGVWGSRDYFFRNNVLATRNLLSACQAGGVGKFVFTSSPSVTFGGDHQQGVDESEPYPETYWCAYPETKAIAERDVLAADDRDGMRTLSLRPHLIWGPGDPHLFPRVVEKARSGKLKIVGDGTNRVDTVHVVNAAAAHLDALDALDRDAQRAAGRAYFISEGQPVELWPWIAEICEMYGVPAPRSRVSYRVARAAGAILERVYRLTGRPSEPPMTRFVAAQLAKDHYFDISAARDRLGYHVRLDFVTAKEMLARDVASKRQGV